MKIDFEFDTPHGVFRDALHLLDDHSFTDSEIETMKQQRRDSWIAVVTAPPTEELPVLLQAPVNSIEIAGEVYQKLEGVPPSGAKVLDVNGVWYFKE